MEERYLKWIFLLVMSSGLKDIQFLDPRIFFSADWYGNYLLDNGTDFACTR